MSLALLITLVALLNPAIAEILDVTTIYRVQQPVANRSHGSPDSITASKEIHLRTNALGKLLRASNGSYLVPAGGTPQLQCVPAAPTCSWEQIGGWSITRQDMHEVQIGGNPCESNNGGCQVTCHYLNSATLCSCPDGYSLNSDRKTCMGDDSLNYLLSSTSGQFAYHQSYNDYGHNKYVTWLIVTPEQHRVQLTFTSFDRDTYYYNVQVYDGDSILAPQLGFFNQPAIPSTLLSTRNKMLVTVRLDGSYTPSGFSANYAAELLGEPTLSLSSAEGSLKSMSLRPTQPMLCMSIIYKLASSSSAMWVSANLPHEHSLNLTRAYITEVGSWRIGLFKGTLTPDDMGHPVIMSAHFTDVGSSVYSIGVCNPYEDEDVFVTVPSVPSSRIPKAVTTQESYLGTTQKCYNGGVWMVHSKECHCPAGFTGDDCQEEDEDVFVTTVPSVPSSSIRKAVTTQESYLGTTQKCYNGGVWMEDSEECHCPAGFTGDDCQEGCGPNSYGQDCGGMCSGFERGCRKMIFCNFNLPCLCAPGFSGELCDSKCSTGFYGASCLRSCGRCSNGSCNIYTGECAAGCSTGFYPPLCQDTYRVLAEPPKVDFKDESSALISANMSVVTGRGHVKFYQFQYKEKESDSWQELQPQVLKTETVFANITEMRSGVRHLARVILIDIDGNSYQEGGVPTVELQTSCGVPNSKEYHLTSTNITTSSFVVSWKYDMLSPTWCPPTGFEVTLQERWEQFQHRQAPGETTAHFSGLLPGRRYEVRVRALTEHGHAPASPTLTVITADKAPGEVTQLQVSPGETGELRVHWNRPRFPGGTIRRYRVDYQCVRLLACPAESCSHSAGQLEVSALSVELTGLRPHAQYVVKVAGLAASLGPYRAALVTTEHTSANTAPDASSTPITERSNNSFVVQWRAPVNCSGLNGFLHGYRYELVATSESGEHVVRTGITGETHAKFTDLTPSTPYHVLVCLVTSGGWNTSHKLTIPATTRATIPEQVRDLVVYKRGRRLIGVRWAPPLLSYGTLKSFTVTHRLQDGDTSTAVSETVAPVHCAAWPTLYCHTITGLVPDTDYEIAVRARNVEVDSDSSPLLVKTITREGAPGAPRGLQILNRTQSSLVVEWGPPDMINGVLRSFLVNVEETDSRNSSDCCKYFPIQELPVRSEEQLYRLEVKDLRPASTLTISVSTKTVTIGPTVNITTSTPPDPPALVHPPELLDRAPEDELFSVELRSAGDFPGLRSTYLLLILPPEEKAEPVMWDQGLLEQLEAAVNQTFYLVAEFQPEELAVGEEVSVGTGAAPQNATLGRVQDPVLEPGTYRAGLALVLDYCGSTSVGFAVGESFTVP